MSIRCTKPFCLFFFSLPFSRLVPFAVFDVQNRAGSPGQQCTRRAPRPMRYKEIHIDPRRRGADGRCFFFLVICLLHRRSWSRGLNDGAFVCPEVPLFLRDTPSLNQDGISAQPGAQGEVRSQPQPHPSVSFTHGFVPSHDVTSLVHGCVCTHCRQQLGRARCHLCRRKPDWRANEQSPPSTPPGPLHSSAPRCSSPLLAPLCDRRPDRTHQTTPGQQRICRLLCRVCGPD